MIWLTAEQAARVRTCDAAHESAVESALGSYPFPHDRMVHRGTLEEAIRASGAPLEVLIAWFQRMLADATVRPLDADLEISWPTRPDADDVALIVKLASDENAWYYEVRVALLLAERVLARGPAPAALVDSLLALRSRLEDDRLHSSEFFRAKVLPWLLRLVAETTPTDLVDLAFIDVHDHWAPAAGEIVRGEDDPAWTGRALMHLGSPRGGTPSKKWWAQTEALFDERPALAAVCDRVLDAVTTIDTSPRDDERSGWDVPDPYLLTPTNELIARGAAWALRLPAPTDDRCELLGRVVLRSAAMVWVVPQHRMLCPKLASATVDTMMKFDADSAREQLATIVREVRVPQLIKRIGPHLGWSAADVKAQIKSLRERGPLPRPDR